MKRFYLSIVASAFLLLPLCTVAQIVETTECSAKIALGGAGVSASNVRIFQDTVLFEEYFEKFQSTLSITFGNTACVVPIPASFTRYPGCRARGIESSAGGLRFSLVNSVFESPELDIPEGSVLKLRAKAGTSQCKFVINGTDTIKVSRNREESKTINLTAGSQRISIRSLQANGFVDSIRVISPITYLAEQNYEIENDTLKISGLKPATAYHVEIEAEQNGVSQNYFLKTENSFANPSARIEDSSSVNLAWQETCNQGKTLHLYKVEDPLDDLLFGRIVYRSTGTNFSLEIFNGTGRDVCLSDYKVGFFNNGNAQENSASWYTFPETDTVKKDSYVMLNYGYEELTQYSYPIYPLEYSQSASGGNDSFILLKKDVSGNYKDTIDVFGRLLQGVNNAQIGYSNRILTRKPTICSGLKHNPISSIEDSVNFVSGWDTVTYSATRLNSDTTFHRLDTPIAYTFVRDVDLTNHPGGVLLDSLDTRSKYLCIITQGSDTIASFGFATGKIIQSIGSGSWNDSSVWDCGQVPESVDKVIIGQGHSIVVNQDSTVNCAQLVLQSDYSTAQADSLKADLQVLGVLNAETFSVEASFGGYTQNTNGWHLFALPIAAESKTRDEIGRMFDRGEDDDLYYLDEQRYAWIPYAPNEQDEHFFTNRNGYLVAYDTNKTLLFSGDMFPQERVTLLDNASFTSGSGNGYHLLCNPYSTSVGLNCFEQNGLDGYWLLEPATGAYTASDNNQPGDFRIPAFGGFIAKVACANNSLVLNPQPIPIAKSAKAQGRVGHLRFGLQTSGGEDELRIYFRQNATWQYDKFDTYKMYSVGSAPDLSCRIGEMSLSVVGLPQFEDTLRLEVELSSKQSEDAVLRLKKCDEAFDHIGLYDKFSGVLLCDFASDSLYNVDMSATDKPRSFDLVLVKRAKSLSDSDSDNIKYSQSGREISILSPEKVDEVVVSDMQGRVVVQTACENIVLPYAGCFVMSVKSGTKYRSVKIMAL